MKYTVIAIAAAFAAPLAIPSAAIAAPIYVADEAENVAVSGYDTVSYFQGNGTPVKGSARFSVQYDGAEWHFSSQENADKFQADPDAYAPQFGGHCAFAMSRGYLVPGDPQAYHIADGKLYLNLNKSVQATWLMDVPGYIKLANAEWKKVPADARFGQ